MHARILSTAIIAAGALLISGGLAGCGVIGPDVKGSGNIKSEMRQVAPFSGVDVEGSADVTVTYGTEQSVTITTDDNILPIITTEVSNGVLKIDATESYSTSYGVKVAVTIPMLQSIEINGSGDVLVEGAQLENRPVENFRIEIDGSGNVQVPQMNAAKTLAQIDGSGDITLAGTGGTLEAEIDGSGDIDAEAFRVLNAVVRVEGSGDIRVYATESLDASVSGSGDIYYRGDPKVLQKSVSGSGDIIRIP